MATNDATAQFRPSIEQALVQWNQGEQQQAVETLHPAAEAGYPSALLLITFFMNQQGRPLEEMLPFVRRAAEDGVFFPAMWFAGRAVGDPAQYEETLALINFIEDSMPWDVTGNALSWAQQGDPERAVQLIEAVASPRPIGLRKQWQELQAEAQASLSTIRDAAAVVDADRDRSSAAIQEHEQIVRQERDRVSRLVADVTSLVHGVTAAHVAKAYAERADSTLTAARWWTAGAILGALAAVGWGGFVAVSAITENLGPTSVIGRALVTLPLLLVAAYLARIAGNSRRMGWHWRHVELQIRTAEPFIAALDDDTRKSLQAALAVRFFPGQSQDPQHAGSVESVDVSTLIAEVFRRLQQERAAPATPQAAVPQGSSGNTS